MKTIIYTIWFLSVVLFCAWSFLTGLGLGLAYYYELPEEMFGMNSLIIGIANYHLLLSSLISFGLILLFVLRNSWEKTIIICGILIVLLLVYLTWVIFLYCHIIGQCPKESSDSLFLVNSLKTYVLKPILIHASLSIIMFLGTGALWRIIQKSGHGGRKETGNYMGESDYLRTEK
jgi:hypothetical protein